MSTGIYVGGEGKLSSKICVVGNAPGGVEAAKKSLFIGRDGKLLMDYMTRAGMPRGLCYLTNVIKERPPSDKLDQFFNFKSKEFTPKGEVYVEILRKELQDCEANVIVAVGNIALKALTGLEGITKYRGSILESSLLPGKKIIPVIHPYSALGEFTFRYFIQHDLYRIKDESQFPEINIGEYNLITEPSFFECMEYLEKCSNSPLVAFDIEVTNEEVDCISFSCKKFEAISIPFIKEGAYFPPDQELEIWKKIAEIIQNPDILTIAHNTVFDASFLCRKYGIKPQNLKDTMINAAVLNPDFPKGLDFLTSIYTKMPYYKDDGKYKNPNITYQEYWVYNAKDSAVLLEIFPQQIEELERQGNSKTAEWQNKLIEPLLYITEHGIKMDVDKLKRFSKEKQDELETLHERLKEETGKDINPNSYKQVREHFYRDLGITPYRKKGKVTSDESAMKKIAGKGYKEAYTILEMRQARKAKSTYFDVLLDKDNRLRSSMNPVGASTGRLSSSATIFGTGTNIQNAPPAFKECWLVDDGHVGFEVDLGQAENRIVAYIAPEHNMIEAFETGQDIHKKTASMIFGKPVELISDEPGSASLGSGNKSERYWGKQGNHSLNYDLGERNFSENCEIPVADGRFIRNNYFSGYPGVKMMHRWIQDELKNSRKLTNLFGRVYTFKSYRMGDQLYKQAYAFIPQSTVGDIINRFGLCEVYYNQNRYYPVKLLNQIHDSILFQIPIRYGWDVISRCLHELCISLEPELNFRGKSFKIPAEATMAINNFKEGRDIGRVTDYSLEELKELLIAEYES